MAKCTCDLCRLVPIMERIAAKCTPEERAVLNELWALAEGAELDAAVADAKARGQWTEKEPRQ